MKTHRLTDEQRATALDVFESRRWRGFVIRTAFKWDLDIEECGQICAEGYLELMRYGTPQSLQRACSRALRRAKQSETGSSSLSNPREFTMFLKTAMQLEMELDTGGDPAPEGPAPGFGRDLYRAYLAHLNPLHVQWAYMYHCEGYYTREIAEACGSNKETVRLRIRDVEKHVRLLEESNANQVH
jgi:hypothetical protein